MYHVTLDSLPNLHPRFYGRDLNSQAALSKPIQSNPVQSPPRYTHAASMKLLANCCASHRLPCYEIFHCSKKVSDIVEMSKAKVEAGAS